MTLGDFRLGAQYQTDKFGFGFVYRSQVDFAAEGDITVLADNAASTTVFPADTGDVTV